MSFGTITLGAEQKTKKSGLMNVVFYPIFISRLMKVSVMLFIKSLAIDYLAFGILIGLGLLFNHFFELPYGLLWIFISFTLGFIVYFVMIMRLGVRGEERGIVLSYFPQFMQKFLRKLA